MSDFVEYIKNMTPEQAQALLRRVQGPPRRILEGQERKDMLLMLALTEPVSNSNNQHAWTDVYHVGRQVFHVTSFSANEDDIVEEILPEDDV
jgi:hypothetical protein